jgi:hypothetical protein
MADTTERSELMSKANNLPFNTDVIANYAEQSNAYFAQRGGVPRSEMLARIYNPCSATKKAII